jgi:hypothetical protein
MRTRFGKVAALLLFASLAATANPVFYGVNLSVGGAGQATGFVETDGVTGTLATADVLDWSITLTDGVDTPDTLLGPLSGGNSFVTAHLSDQSATASAIVFDFGASDGGYFLFETNALPADFLCFGPADGVCTLSATGNVEAISLNNSYQSTSLTGAEAVASPEPRTWALTGLAVCAFAIRRRRFGPLAELR